MFANVVQCLNIRPTSTYIYLRGMNTYEPTYEHRLSWAVAYFYTASISRTLRTNRLPCAI